MPKEIDAKLLERTWLHAHEEDTENQRVFRPDTYQLAPSRGRAGYDFQSRGVVVRRMPGPNDRGVFAKGTWTLSSDGRVTIRISGAPEEVFDIEDLDADRLVVKK